jgi:hypothetical protein
VNHLRRSLAILVLLTAACDKSAAPQTSAPSDGPAPAPGTTSTASASVSSTDAPPVAAAPLTGEAVLEGLELGDRACYVQLATDAGSTSREGDFELCPGAARDASKLVGKRVVYTAERANVLAASCAGDVDCGKSDVVDIITTLVLAGATAQAIALDDLDADGAMGLLGKPARKTSEEWAMDGQVYTTWTWPSHGVVLITGAMRSVFSVTCEGSCALKTKAGIGIGSTVDEVKTAYGKQINKRESSATDLVIGDAYGGTFFAIDGGKVVRIFIGTAAE